MANEHSYIPAITADEDIKNSERGKPTTQLTRWNEIRRREEKVCRAFELAKTWVLQSQYNKNRGDNAISVFGRIWDWIDDEEKAVQNELQQAKDILKAFFSLYESLLKDIEDNMLTDEQDEEFKKKWARVNQRLAQEYAVSIINQNESAIAGFELLRRIAGKIAENDAIFGKIRNIIDGARAQGALMKFFHDKGCFVVVPDPDNDSEIEELDVKHGIDFYVVTPTGAVIMINAKSRNMIDTSEKDEQDKPYQATLQQKHSILFKNAILPYLQRYFNDETQSEFRINFEELRERIKNRTRGIYRYDIIVVVPEEIQNNGELEKQTKNMLVRCYLESSK